METELLPEADKRIEKGTQLMAENVKLDADAIRRDLESMGVAAVARKYNRARSTIAHYRPRNGAKPEPAAVHANGHHARNADAGQAEELHKLFDAHFQGLPLTAKARLLLHPATHEPVQS